uniref:Inositol polyphosphate-related phosphatase domain-containing protein n=1 Tax=Euplotes crassus TaxID=5936 RepID=A0A7S3NRQ2_EUPCR|mmetsp:Transcript_14076/g.14062  ORF Transcript_14076/g.14062 Transcript_14076/m.14062 type:complete len:284 (+) Transcript_14076:960-1811(+)
MINKSDTYDTSKKRRVPAWTDRILWYHNEEESKDKGSQYISPILYERRETNFSDHRPVVAYFEIHAHRHCSEKKAKIKNTIASKKATSFIVKKPSYDPAETQVKKEFGDDFDLFSSPPKKEQHIHLDLNVNRAHPKTKEEVKRQTPNKDSPIDDLLQFDNNLIDIREKKQDDGNLIDFSSKTRQMPHPGHRFYPHAHSMHGRNPYVQIQGPIQGVHNGFGMQNHFPMYTPKPMGFFNSNTGTKGPRMRASVPRKPSADLIGKAAPNNVPQKKAMPRTEEFFKF